MRILANTIFIVVYNEMCQHLKELSDSMNQYFLNDPYLIIQKHLLVKYLFKVQERPMDFNVK